MAERKLKQEEVKHWEGRINLAKQIVAHREQAYWDPAIRRYANRGMDAVMGTGAEDDNVRVNLLYSNIRTKQPHLFSRFPDLFVLPNQPDIPEDGPELVRALLLRYAKINGAKEKVNRAVLDSLLQSMGVLKVGYTTRSVTTILPPKTLMGKVKEFAGRMMKQNKNPKDTSSVDQSLPDHIISEGPTLTRVSPRKILTHPDARHPYDSGAYWLAHAVTYPLEVIQNDDRFPAAWRRDLKPSHALDMDKLPTGIQGFDPVNTEDPALQFVTLYEIWDRTHREVLTFAEGNWDLGEGRVVDWPFDGMEGFPFIFLIPSEIPEATCGDALTEMDPVINQFEELDAIRTLQLRHMRRFSTRKYSYNSDVVDGDELDKLRKDEDCLVPIDADGSVAGFIAPIEDLPLPADVYAAEERVKRDIDEVSGTSEFKRGLVGGSSTATEASIVEEASEERAGFSRDQIDDFIIEYFTKTLKIMQQWLPKDLAVRIFGELGEAWVENVTPEMIAGEFEFEVIPGSSGPRNLSRLRAEAMNVYAQALVNNPLVEQREALVMLLEHFPELLRNGRIKKLVKNPQAVQGPVPPEGLSEAPPAAMGPGPSGQPPIPPEELQAMLAEGGPPNGGQPQF